MAPVRLNYASYHKTKIQCLVIEFVLFVPYIYYYEINNERSLFALYTTQTIWKTL